MPRTFEFDRAKNWVHLNLTVQSTGSFIPPNTFSAAGKKIYNSRELFSFCFVFS